MSENTKVRYPKTPLWMDKEEIINLMNDAQTYAEHSGMCKKVDVGTVLICGKNETSPRIFGANKCLPENCREVGCRRIELYGEDSKNHRLPSDCRSIHSEIYALASAAEFGVSTQGAIAIVTRYPCEACARALVTAGIVHVIYGREQKISEETARIFDSGGVYVTWLKEWYNDDTTR